MFVGPSNAGKSMLAVLIYALHCVFGRRSFDSEPLDIAMRRAWSEDADTRRALRASIVQAMMELRRAETQSSDTQMLNLDISSELIEWIRRSFQNRTNEIKHEIERCFGSELKHLVRNRSHPPSVLYVRNGMSDQESFGFSFDFLTEKLSVEVPNQSQITFPTNKLVAEHKQIFDYLENEELDDDLLDRYDYRILSELCNEIAAGFASPAYYLPADRAWIMHAQSVLVGSILDQVADAGIVSNRNTPTLTGVSTDFLKSLMLQENGLGQSTAPGEYSDFATEVENRVLRGSIQVRENAIPQYRTIEYVPEGRSKGIPMINTSSTVSELAPVIVYLRECIATGGLLIIEEPESHLHPAMQVELTRIVAGLVAAGLQVIVTTHSEWITEELANVIARAKSLKSSGNSSNKFGGLPALDSSEVGVWLFEKSKSGGKSSSFDVRECEIEDSGLFSTGYDDVAQQLHQDWVETRA